jgi:hypothetical protein
VPDTYFVHSGSNPPLGTQGSGSGLWATLVILDNEWRWEMVAKSQVDHRYETPRFTYQPSAAPGVLISDYIVSKEKKGTLTPLDGPNSVYAQLHGGLAWTGPGGTPTFQVAFDADRQTGIITAQQGPLPDGDFEAGDLKVRVGMVGTPQIDNTAHMVTIYVDGGAGVNGTWSPGVTFGEGIAFGFSVDQQWGVYAGTYKTIVVLRLVKGASN